MYCTYNVTIINQSINHTADPDGGRQRAPHAELRILLELPVDVNADRRAAKCHL